MTDYSTWTDEQLMAESQAIAEESNRRSAMAYIPEQMALLNEQYLDAAGTEQGEEWVQPTGSHDAYPLDWVVMHNSGTWRSLVAGNVWEPGVSGWAVEGGGEWPMWVAPTGGHDAYASGSKVSHVDKHWTSDVDANVWEPGVFGWTEAA